MAHTLVIEHDVYKALQESFGEKSLNEKFNQILPRFNFPSVENRKHRAVPETVAAAMWLNKSASNDDVTNYLIIDIGAGTTDITLYRYSDTNYDKFPIYGTNCIIIAGDDFLSEFIQWLAVQYQCKRLESTTDMIRKVRDAKNRLPSTAKTQKYRLGSKTIELDFDTYKNQILLGNFNKIFDRINEAFKMAFAKDKTPSSWREMKTVIIGGGGKIQGIEGLFKDRQLRDFVKQKFIEPYIPTNAIIPINENFTFLTIAYGLSYPVAELPSIRWPEEIKSKENGHNREEKREYDILDLYRE